MQNIEPYYNWTKHYVSATDRKSPFYGRHDDFNSYDRSIYSYLIHPLWDDIESETLYVKILFADYRKKIAVIELFGEWNDTLHNDIMLLKRHVIDHLLAQGIKYFVLIGENVFNFHGSDDEYYAEWFDEVEDGWIAAVCFRDFVEREWRRYQIDSYINCGGTLHIDNWRVMQPLAFFEVVKSLIMRRIYF